MKHVRCPACGATTPITPGMTGKTWVCACGSRIFLPQPRTTLHHPSTEDRQAGPEEEVLDVLPAPEEAMVRCYECGRLVSVEDAVRKDVRTGSGFVTGAGIYGSSDTWSRVDYCRRCLRKQREYKVQRWTATWKTARPFLVVAAIVLPAFLIAAALLAWAFNRAAR